MPRVLVADDSFMARQVFIKILKIRGYEVIEASNGKEAMDKILMESPDCLLLDLVMPVMDGFEVLSALQKQKLSVPAIIVSADIQDTSRAKCYELGAVGFLNKPVKEGEIISTVEAAMAARGGTNR